MNRLARRQNRRYVTRIIATRLVVAGVSTALITVGATQFMSIPLRPTSAVDVLDTAEIVDSPDTVGFADSDLYNMTPAQIDANLDLLQATGSTTVRILIPWAGVEPTPNTYNWTQVDTIVNAAAARGLAVDGVLTSTPSYATIPGTPAISGAPANPAQYAAFAGQVAARYVGKVSAYEIYNEPNSALSFQATDPAAVYTSLLKAAYPAIKAADPTATVVGGVLGAGVDYGNITINPVTFLSEVYKDGGAGYFDALSFHPYQYTTELSQGASLPNSPLNQLTALRQLMVANGDANKMIWATEYGLPTNTVSPQTQATFISDFLNTYSALSYAGPSFIYTVQDTTANIDPDTTFGVFNLDGTAKPAEQVIQQFIATHPVTATPPVTTPPVTTPPVTTPPVTTPPNPYAAYAAQVAAYEQQLVATYQAYVTALATAWAAAGQPAATPAATTPAVAKLAVATTPVAVKAVTAQVATPTSTPVQTTTAATKPGTPTVSAVPAVTPAATPTVTSKTSTSTPLVAARASTVHPTAGADVASPPHPGSTTDTPDKKDATGGLSGHGKRGKRDTETTSNTTDATSSAGGSHKHAGHS